MSKRKIVKIPKFLETFDAADAWLRKYSPDSVPEAPDIKEPVEPDEDSDDFESEQEAYDEQMNEYKEAQEEYDMLSDTYEDRITSYMAACEEAIREWNENGTPITLYRAIVTKLKKGVPYINIDSLGKAWSIRRSGAAPQNARKPPKWAGKEVTAVIQGLISPQDIDWEYGFVSFMSYGEEQWEFSVKKHVPITITHIDDKKLPEPILGNSGDAQEAWTGKNPPARENPVSRREDANALFRSVSPWEMAEILRTGVIEGRSGWFSGDPRREKIKLWFGEKLADVAHNGEDWTRYVESSEPFTTLSEQAWRLEQIASAIRKQKPKFQFATTPLDKLRYDAEDLAAKLREKRREAISKITESLEKQRAAMKVTSYIIETFDVPGGTRYTEGDSLSPGSEVGFADSVSYADASTVYLIRTRQVDNTDENAVRWEVVDSVNPQDLKVEVPSIPAKSIIAIDTLVQKSEPKVLAIEDRAARLMSFQRSEV